MDRREFLKGAAALTGGAAVVSTPVAAVAHQVDLKKESEDKPKTPDVIRLWKLGDIEHNIYPTQQTIEKLASILSDNPGGTFDIIWGPDLTCEVINTDGVEVADVIMKQQLPTSDIADKIIELMPEIGMDHGNAHTTIVYAIETVLKEWQNAKKD